MKHHRPHHRLIVKETKKYGKGVFAGELIKKGSIIHMLDGKKTPLTILVDRIISGKESIDDPFQIGKKTYIDLDALSRTFNHSCNPASGVRKVGEMFALKDIQKGEEITYDYSLIMAPTEYEMKCKCGFKNCRKKIGHVLTIPEKRREEYQKIGNVQRYMRSLLKEVKKNGSYKMPKYEIAALKKLKAHGIQ